MLPLSCRASCVLLALLAGVLDEIDASPSVPRSGGPARAPPMGWSSWYAFGPSVNQERMEDTFLKLTNRSVKHGANFSLRDAGYSFANIDDGWQACHAGVDGSFHSASGEPLVNTTRFPNLSAMTSRAASLGLRPGFYFNNYICAEGMPTGGIGGQAYLRNMKGSVEFLSKHKFRYIKIDSGSVYNDMQLWYDLINASGNSIVIENCHQGHLLPNETWCPFETFRTSGDLHVVGLDVELLATAFALGRSRQDCWAYPDTLDAGTPAEVRSQFGAYAIMSAPLILSFDILDDSKLLPVWDILTNPEAIRVNQLWAGSPGKLLRKWSPHLASDPVFPWALPCNSSSPELGPSSPELGWAYNGRTGKVSWQSASGSSLCLTAEASGSVLRLEACREADSKQSWTLEGSRLWQRNSSLVDLEAEGILQISPCDASKPGQYWKLSAAPGDSKPCNVRNDISFREGGCWEITACDTKDSAEVGVNFGCKPLPAAGQGGCAANGAWSFNFNGSITSIMDGKCLRVDPRDNKTVNVASCGMNQTETWEVHGQMIKPVGMPGMCVDSVLPAPPPGTSGRCAALQVTNDAGGAGAWKGIFGPALHLTEGNACDPSIEPEQPLAFTASGEFRIGQLCAQAEHGMPTPFGPLQLWSKPQPDGAAAVLLLNRAPAGSQRLNVSVALQDLPGLQLRGSSRVHIRDVWARRELEPVEDRTIWMSAPGGDSQFLVLKPEPKARDSMPVLFEAFV